MTECGIMAPVVDAAVESVYSFACLDNSGQFMC